MGCVAATAKRRRKQAVNGYRHLGKMVRPRYKMKSLAKLDRRLQMLRERKRQMEMRKGFK